MKNLLILLTIALVAAACGSSGDDAADTDDPLVQAIADDIAADPDTPFREREAAECFAADIVGGIGTDRLAELGVSASSVADLDDIDFNDSEIGRVVDSLDKCVDLEQALADSLAEDGTMAADDAECLIGELGTDVIKDAFRSTFSGGDTEPTNAFLQAMLDAAAACDIPLG